MKKVLLMTTISVDQEVRALLEERRGPYEPLNEVVRRELGLKPRAGLLKELNKTYGDLDSRASGANGESSGGGTES